MITRLSGSWKACTVEPKVQSEPVQSWFETLVEVLLGCVLLLLLFIVMLEVVMALRDVEDAGIQVSEAGSVTFISQAT